MKKPKSVSRQASQEDEQVNLSRTMTPQQRLEAAARLSAIAFEFHQAGTKHRAALRAADRAETSGEGEAQDEA